MTYPIELASVLSGASISQLRRWNTTGLLRPEVEGRPVQYSFRDVVALRTIAHLRRATSLQKVRKALNVLQYLDLTDHPSRYRLVTDKTTIALVEDDGATDLLRAPGQRILVTLDDVFAPFTARSGRVVADLRHPRPHLEVREQRVGGWPTIADSRVPFDAVAKLVVGGVAASEVRHFYPGVSQGAALDAADLWSEVQSLREPVAV